MALSRGTVSKFQEDLGKVCDFLSTLLTVRLLKCFDKAGLLNEMNYGKVMNLLKRAKKIKLQKLSLLPKPEEPEKSLTDWENIN